MNAREEWTLTGLVEVNAVKILTAILLALLCACFSVVSAQAAPANVIALYRFNSGTPADSLGLHNATIGGGATLSNQGLVVTGNGYAVLGNVNTNPSQPQTSGTVDVWANLSAVPLPDFALVGAGNTYGGDMDYLYLGVYSQTNPADVVFGIYTSAGGWYWADSGVLASSLVGTEHEFTGSWGASGVQVWIDGRLLSTNSAFTAALPTYTTYLAGSDSWMWGSKASIQQVAISDVAGNLVALPEPCIFLEFFALLALAQCFPCRC